MYIENRRAKGFTVIQAVALAELDGLHDPNPYGDIPLLDDNPSQPLTTPGSDPSNPDEYDYWDHVDFIVNTAAEKGLYIGLLPTWGDKVVLQWGVGPVVFNPENARAYGEWIAARYGGSPNIIWILGGDRRAMTDDTDYRCVWDAMAAGILSNDPDALITYHPRGGHSSSDWLHEKEWLDFNMCQSGHAAKNIPNYNMVAEDYAKTPMKPCMDSEPRYEDHAVNWNPEHGWFDEFDVRQAAYWGLFAGGHGTTYGCHPVWQMYDEGRKPITHARHFWHEVLDLPGAHQMTYVKNLMLSRDFLSRVPDQSVIIDGQTDGAGHVVATRGKNYMFVYLPTGRTITVCPRKLLGDSFAVWWFNPRTGETVSEGTMSLSDAPFTVDAPGEEAPGLDWVLVIDNTAGGYGAPGELRQ